MDLKIKDVAELLNVSETTIRRWLLDGKIPAYKLNRQYRFSRIEIENWMLRQKLSLSEQAKPIHPKEPQQIYPVEKQTQPGNQQYSLYRAINRGGIYHDIPGDTKEEIIRSAVPHIAEKVRLDADVLTELLLDRERLMPTAFNNGVAVPHTRESLGHAAFDFVAVVFPQKAIDYGALDNQPVDILFFLFATDDKNHLHLLAKIAHLSSDQKFLTFLRTHPQKASLLEQVRERESSLRA